MKTGIIFLIVTLAFSACEKKDNGYECEAIVLTSVNNEIISCDKDVFSLKFIRGENKVKSIIGSDYNVTDSVYSVLNLPGELMVTGLIIKLDVREPQSGEFPNCYNFEMPVVLGPVVSVTRAEKK